MFRLYSITESYNERNLFSLLDHYDKSLLNNILFYLLNGHKNFLHEENQKWKLKDLTTLRNTDNSQNTYYFLESLPNKTT